MSIYSHVVQQKRLANRRNGENNYIYTNVSVVLINYKFKPLVYLFSQRYMFLIVDVGLYIYIYCTDEIQIQTIVFVIFFQREKNILDL